MATTMQESIHVCVSSRYMEVYYNKTMLNVVINVYTHTGICDLLLTNLSEPDKTRRSIRSVDPLFFQALVKRFESDPSAPGVPPIADLCTSISCPNVYNMKRKYAYRFEVGDNTLRSPEGR